MFHKCSGTVDGLQNYCKNCKYKLNTRKGNSISEGYKECQKCYEIKPVSEFYESRITDDGYFENCKDCCHVDTAFVNQTKKNNEHYSQYFHTTRIH